MEIKDDILAGIKEITNRAWLCYGRQNK